MLGLVQALRSTTEHPPKKTYLYARIRGAILDSLRTHDWLPRRMRDEVKAGSIATSIVFIDDLEPSWEEKVGTDDENSPRAQHDIQSAIARALGELPERDREIIQGIYFDGKTSKVLAEDWHVSSARISQLHSRAIVALRKKLRIFMREYSSNQYKE